MPSPPQPIVRRLEDGPWEGWPADQVAQRGAVTWRDRFGGDAAAGTNMVMGVVRVRHGESLEPHRHSEPEAYYTLAGEGEVRVEDRQIPVRPGFAIYIPADALHGITNGHDADLTILYTFAVGSWDQVVYRL